MQLSPSHPSIVALAAACPPIPEHVREIVDEEKTLSEAGARFAEILDAVTAPLAILRFEAEQGSTVDVLHLDAEGVPTLTGIHIGLEKGDIASDSVMLSQDEGDRYSVLSSYQSCEPPLDDVIRTLDEATA